MAGQLSTLEGGKHTYDYNELFVNGKKVLGDQGATVADPTGGGTVDAEARTAIDALIDRLEAHGIIASS